MQRGENAARSLLRFWTSSDQMWQYHNTITKQCTESVKWLNAIRGTRIAGRNAVAESTFSSHAMKPRTITSTAAGHEERTMSETLIERIKRWSKEMPNG